MWKSAELKRVRRRGCNTNALFVLFLLNLTLLCVFSHPWLGPLSVPYRLFLISEFLSGQTSMSEYSDLRHFSATLLGKAQRGWKNATLPYRCLQWLQYACVCQMVVWVYGWFWEQWMLSVLTHEWHKYNKSVHDNAAMYCVAKNSYKCINLPNMFLSLK